MNTEGHSVAASAEGATVQMSFTARQLKHFAAFERVRASGLFNMYDPRARALTKLDRDDYLFVMKNYVELAEQAKATKAAA